jgi:hypothetical protein
MVRGGTSVNIPAASLDKTDAINHLAAFREEKTDFRGTFIRRLR